jgi:hypothetical protein
MRPLDWAQVFVVALLWGVLLNLLGARAVLRSAGIHR